MSVTSSTRRSIPPLAIALGLSLGTVVGQGFSRFAYALLLPPMKTDLGWNFTQAGGLNAANAFGYIVGAALAASLGGRLGVRAGYIASFICSSVLLLGTGLTEHYGLLLAVRFLGGITTAVAFVLGSALAAQLPATLGFLFFSGPGLGIALSGVLVPAALGTAHPHAWRWGWIGLGILSLAMLLPTALAAGAVSATAREDRGDRLRWTEHRHMMPTYLNYGLFGAGYAGYMTFVIALLRAQHQSSLMTSLFWIVLGLASAASIPLWSPLLTRLRAGYGPALVSLVIMAGTLPVLFPPSLPLTLLSGFLFGGSFMASITAAVTITRRDLAPEVWTAMFGVLTTIFALGQAVGPVISGWISDATHSLSSGLWAAPVLLALSAVLGLLQQERRIVRDEQLTTL